MTYVVGRLFQGVCKKGAVHHGRFLSWQVDNKLSLLPNLIRSQFPPVSIESPPVSMDTRGWLQAPFSSKSGQWLTVINLNWSPVASYTDIKRASGLSRLFTMFCNSIVRKRKLEEANAGKDNVPFNNSIEQSPEKKGCFLSLKRFLCFSQSL